MWQSGLNAELVRRVEAFIVDARRQGIRLDVRSALRTRAQQEVLYRRAQSGQSSLPAAKPGTSKHERGLAVDVGVTGRTAEQVPWSMWEKLGAIGERSGLKWLGRFDKVHFELPSAGGVSKGAVPDGALSFADGWSRPVLIIGAVLVLAVLVILLRHKKPHS